MNIYSINCPECNSYLETITGFTYDSFPASYPVKCSKCEWKGHSETNEERELFDNMINERKLND